MTNTKILIVDDEEANRVTLDAVLSRENYELHFAGSGSEACTIAPAIYPDLILLDIMMPDMDGFEVCRRLRADPVIGSVPILMLTALNDQQSRIAGINAGADDFISKPCAFEELRARVRTITRLNRFRVIAEQRARFERLFTITPSAIAIVSPDGYIATTNDLAKHLLAPFAGRDLAGLPLSACLPPAAAAQIGEVVDRTCRDTFLPEQIQITLPSPDGDRFFAIKAARLAESDSNLVMIILHDITAEVRAREELVSLNERLDALVRDRTRQLETANELLLSYTAFVSHDLRSPLSVVRGYLSLLNSGGIAVSDEALKLINEAFVASGMMEDMIGNILAMASDEHHARLPATAIDPKPILERLAWKLASFMPKPRPRITVGDLPRVYATAPLIERVFYNLISNAIKYAAQGREVRIDIGATPTPTGTAIHVRDNGIGFDSGHAERLFKAFSRLPGSEKCEGLGLGLSMVSRLISAHQGRIWAEGRPGEGATFYVEFKQAGASAGA